MRTPYDPILEAFGWAPFAMGLFVASAIVGLLIFEPLGAGVLVVMGTLFGCWLDTSETKLAEHARVLVALIGTLAVVVALGYALWRGWHLPISRWLRLWPY